MDGDWPLTGRELELERIVSQLDSGRRGVVLVGPAGVGKTRLATECLEVAARRGFSIVRVAATPVTTPLAFGAFSALLPEVRATGDRAETLREIERGILARAGDRPVALLVDDAHLLDELSAALTHQLTASAGAFVLATVRTGEPVPDAVLALWKDGRAERVDLRPLGQTEVDQLLSAGLGRPVSRATSRLLYERSAGNVLFLRELVLGALDSGLLREESGVWHLTAPLVASARLLELIEARLVGLTDNERHGLELLALSGPMGVSPFSVLVGKESLLTLERRRLVHVKQERRRIEVRLAHTLYGEVLRALLSPVRTVAHRLALAEVFANHAGRRRDDLLRLAILRLELGNANDPTMMLAAAERARTLHDYDLAERLALSAIDAGGGFEARLLLGQVFSLSGRSEQAEQQYAALTELADDDARRGRLAIARLDNLCYSLGWLDAAARVAEEAEASIADPDWRDEITAYRASLCDSSGRTGDALELAVPLMGRATGPAFVWACAMAATGFAKAGRVTEAIEAAERGRAAHLSLPNEALPWSPSLHVALRTFALAFGVYLSDAERETEEEYERGIAEGSDETQSIMGAVLATVYMAQGRLASAIRVGREAVTLARERGRLIPLRAGLVPLVEALALAGRADEADQLLRQLDAMANPFVRVVEAEITRARAWTAVGQGRIEDARRLLQQAAGMAADSADLVWEAAAVHGLARLGQPALAIPRLRELVEVLEGPLVPLRFDHVRALVVRDAATLEAVSAAFEEIGAVLLAAEAAADAGSAWRQGGEPRRADAADRRAGNLARLCDLARTSALTMSSLLRASLTEKELEIARLAAAGHSNREIARQLFLSLHTVQTGCT